MGRGKGGGMAPLTFLRSKKEKREAKKKNKEF